MPDAETYLTVAVSSRALFDLDESDAVYREHGLEAYRRYQIVHEDETLAPGEGFTFVTKLLGLNEELGRRRVDVILLSRNSADTGLRVFNSIHAHDLDIVRAAFSSGASPYRYARAFGCDLFLSTEAGDVQHALDSGMAAATLLARGRANETRPDARGSTLKIAFDGDAVLFADSADRIYRDEGLEAFASAEAAAADEPLGGGPFKPFLEGLHRLQEEFDGRDCPIRTALVTARARQPTNASSRRCVRGTSAWTRACSSAAWTRESSCAPTRRTCSSTTRPGTAAPPASTSLPATSRTACATRQARWRSCGFRNPVQLSR